MRNGLVVSKVDLKNAAGFCDLRRVLSKMGILHEEQVRLFIGVSAILRLGDIPILTGQPADLGLDQDDEDDICAVIDKHHPATAQVIFSTYASRLCPHEFLVW